MLFWLSLVPFATAWLGESPLATLPVALYGLVLTLAALAYYILVRTLVSLHGLPGHLHPPGHHLARTRSPV